MLQKFLQFKIGSIHLNGVILAANTKISATPIQMNGTVAKMSATWVACEYSLTAPPPPPLTMCYL